MQGPAIGLCVGCYEMAKTVRMHPPRRQAWFLKAEKALWLAHGVPREQSVSEGGCTGGLEYKE